jgi:hypothetical protein
MNRIYITDILVTVLKNKNKGSTDIFLYLFTVDKIICENKSADSISPDLMNQCKLEGTILIFDSSMSDENIVWSGKYLPIKTPITIDGALAL